MSYPYFEQAGPCYAEDDLKGWFKHFEAQGIGCCIVKNKCRMGHVFSLWRTGLESRAITNLSKQPTANNAKITGDVVRIYDPHGVFAKCKIRKNGGK